MLGELLFESKGKIRPPSIISRKRDSQIEISIAGTGQFTGSLEVTTSWTYWAIQRPDGTSYSEGQGIIMTNDGRGVATATGCAEGKMVESGKMRYVGALFYETHSEN